ncbi:hypothetical protein [Paraburkholderia sp. BCC1886]|uniref:hypothetical protein n=1 Tax=Paraburkholderia sp. BCC1886 TaxID=2562670 RepID=UPI0011845E50|nr:hypothetical protein [Paraburkholderia sp. BCC1886]
MSVIAETKALRAQLKALAAKPEWDMLTRYDLLGKKPPSALKDRLWRRVRRFLAAARLISPHVTPYTWMPTLKHRPLAADVNTLAIWAVGANRNELRAACEGFSKKLENADTLAPVLMTDVADFAFYSRLGWLVEYLPELSGEGQSYRQKKLAYLAWRYRHACTVSFSAGLAGEQEWNALVKVSRK